MRAPLTLALLGLLAGTAGADEGGAPHPAMPLMAEPAPAAAPAAPDSTATRRAFASAYAATGTPRIAVYYNRELSGRLEEWITPTRKKTINTKPNGDIVQGESYTQMRDFNETARPKPDEKWSWAFEDGFYTSFLEQKVRLVDRSTILRLAAVDRPDTPSETVPLKRVEIDALKKHADLVIEVLVGRSATGYEFKAKVMEVQTGRLLAMVNGSPDTGDAKAAPGRFVAGPRGYEREVVAPEAADARAQGAQFADEVMRRLTRTWMP